MIALAIFIIAILIFISFWIEKQIKTLRFDSKEFIKFYKDNKLNEEAKNREIVRDYYKNSEKNTPLIQKYLDELPEIIVKSPNREIYPIEKEKNELFKQHEENKRKQQKSTLEMRTKFENAVIDGDRIVEVGDMLWFYDSYTKAAAAVRTESNKYLVLGYINGIFEIPKLCKFSWVLDILDHLPYLKLDGEGYIEVWFEESQYIMLSCVCTDWENGTYGWEYSGIGCCGNFALEKFSTHGVNFIVEEIENNNNEWDNS